MCRKSSIRYWPDHLLSGNQKRFWRDPVNRSSASMRSSAVLLKRKARASLSSDRSRSFKSVIVVRPLALPLLPLLKNRTVSWCLPGNLGRLFDFLICSSQPDRSRRSRALQRVRSGKMNKTLFAVFIGIGIASAQTPPPDQARQVQLQKEAMRRAAAQVQAFTILGFPTLSPHPIFILQGR